MMLKPDQERIKSLLSETITLLCRNGLNFKSEFSVEALIGITLDQSEVFLVNIKETVQTSEVATATPEPACTWDISNSHITTGPSGQTNQPSATKKDYTDYRSRKRKDTSLKYSQNVLRRCGSSSEAWNLHNGYSERVQEKESKKFESNNILDINEALTSKVKRARIDFPTTTRRERTDYGEKKTSLNQREIEDNKNFDEEVACTIQENNVSVEGSPKTSSINVKSELLPEVRSHSPINRKTPSLEDQSPVKQSTQSCEVRQSEELSEDDIQEHNDDDDDEVVFVKNEPSDYHMSNMSDASGTYDRWPRGDTSEQWRENTGYKSGEWAETEDLAGGGPGPSGFPGLRNKLHGSRSKLKGQLTETGGSSYEYDEMNMKLAHNPLSSAEATDLSSNYSLARSAVSHSSGPPDLSGDELVIARSVLSMRGSFISLGCLKANRQLIRRVSREHLIAIINKMSTPTDPAYFIGLLFDFGISRVFYKCPPSSVTDAALTFYGFSGERYNDCYMRQVIVDKNIRDPEAWIQKLQERSPFTR